MTLRSMRILGGARELGMRSTAGDTDCAGEVASAVSVQDVRVVDGISSGEDGGGKNERITGDLSRDGERHGGRKAGRVGSSGIDAVAALVQWTRTGAAAREADERTGLISGQADVGATELAFEDWPEGLC